MVVQAQELGLTVYRIPFSTNVERIALAAGRKGLEIHWVDVDPDDRSVVEQVSGQPLVPVLVHGDEVVADSPRILDWIEAHVPEPPLYPADPHLRAAVEVFVHWFNRVWKVAPNRLVEGDDEGPRRELHDSMRLFDGLLHGRDYLFGEFGMADVIAFPFLKYPVFGLAPDDADPFHRVLVEGLPRTPRVDAWARRVDAQPRG